MSEKRFLGWEPREVHEHEYDDAGRLVRTVVTREVEWDDWERQKMLDLADHEAHLCECGFPESIADQDPDLEITHRVCPVCAGLAQAGRIQAEADKREVSALGAAPPPAARLPSDGRKVGLRSKPSATAGVDGDSVAS